MNQGNLKNMVVLKNLPSNIVEEAIVILKSNNKVKHIEKIEKNRSKINLEEKKKEKDYLIKEAEILVSNYISILEQKKKDKNINNKKLNHKYIKVRNYALVASLIIFLEGLVILIK
ncbi:MAG: hypothetical protein U0L98_00045 [Clostridia bacterium]|nr:hypothetical protein [Clostridia bacterium]